MSKIVFVVPWVFACSYHAGSFRDPQRVWPGVGTTLGCVDVAVGNGADPEVAGPILAYGVGNRCDDRVVVDLTALRVIARGVDGGEAALVADDPRGELHPQPLAARWSGRIQIAYRGAGTAPIASICVDVGRIDRTIAPRERWICVAQERS